MIKINKRIVCIGLGLLLCLNILAWQQVFALSGPAQLKLYFLDVGQGDSAFIETPEHQQILIDGGPNAKVLEELSKVMPFFDRSIDLVILTHPDSDHLDGLVDVLKSYKVGMVAFNGAEGTDPAFAEFKKLIADKKIPTVILYQGKRVVMAQDLYFNIDWPEQSFEGQTVADFNTSSIVSQLVYGKIKFLFEADAPKTAEEKIIAENIDLASDALKVGHHGSKTSSSDEFLQEVAPQIAVISVGKDNKFGHPAPETLQRLDDHNIKYLRTDEIGAIKIISDGNSFQLVKQLIF